MAIIGLQRKDGVLLTIEDAIATATLMGEVDGYPLPALVGILNNRDIRYPTASQMAGGYWRKTVLEHLVDYYVKPADMMRPLRGNMVHHLLEGLSGEEVVTEQRLEYLVPDSDIFLSGQIDAYYPKFGRLDDYKSVSQVSYAMRDYHLSQLAIYKWLAEWNGFPVREAAIVYITWDDMRRVKTAEYDKSFIQAIKHPLLADEKYFLEWIQLPWKILSDGFDRHLVPDKMYCKMNSCRYCSIKWACDQISDRGEFINPKEFVQEE
jgi:hypothetical protein